eukprot:5560285-Pyramimonas_sp.AAC.1
MVVWVVVGRRGGHNQIVVYQIRLHRLRKKDDPDVRKEHTTFKNLQTPSKTLKQKPLRSPPERLVGVLLRAS